MSIAGALIAAVAILSGEAADDWTPRQVQLIKASDAVVYADTMAFINTCLVVDGKARYAAIAERVKAVMPKLKQELGDYPVYEIFVVRAPQMNPSLVPPERCKPRKKYKPENESAMTHYDETATALVALVEAR